MSAWLAQERAHPLKEGTTAGRYAVGAVIDADAISVTYTAHDTEQNRGVCLREFLPCLISRRDPDGAVRSAQPECTEAFNWAKDTFLREGQAQLRVHHPSLAPITALQTVNGSTFLASVPLEGQTLAALLGAHGRLDAQELHELATPLLAALKVLHGADALHLGLSPKSIWITNEGVPVLSPSARGAIDLAQGLELDDLLTDLAPELIDPEDQALVGRQTDVFGLGAALFAAATGGPPADIGLRVAAYNDGSEDPYEPVEFKAEGAMPAVMAAAINAALALDPRVRPQSMDIWKAQFQGRRVSEADLLAEPAADATPASGAKEQLVAQADVAASAQPARLSAPIQPPAPAVQPELPLLIETAVAETPAEQAIAARQAEASDLPSRVPTHQAPPDPAQVAPRRAAAAIASAKAVAAVAREATPRNIARLSTFGGRIAATTVATTTAAADGTGRRARAAMSGTARGTARGVGWTKGLLSRAGGLFGGLARTAAVDRRVVFGSAGAAGLAVVVAGGLWLFQSSAPPDGPNVTSLKMAEQRSREAAGADKSADKSAGDADTDAAAKEAEREKARERARQAARETAEREAAEKAAEKAAAEAEAEKAKQREALAADWKRIQALKGKARVAAEKAYFERAGEIYASDAKAWHEAATVAHRAGDFRKAFAGYEKAALAGHVPAQVSIGFFYVNGHGVKANPVKAARWFRRAAERGNRVAQSNLAGQYTTGRGVKRNYKAAHRWALLAAKQGDPTAHGRLGYLYRYGHGVKKDPKTAMKWYRKGADLHHVWSMAEIGALYENGEGVKRDPKKAAAWYRRARRQGSQYAERRLVALRKDAAQ